MSLSSCNDGDFDVPSFEFSETVNSCGEYILYVKNSSSTELLAISLVKAQLGTTVGTKNYDISTTSSATTITATYRIVDAAIGSSYFCQSIPPTTPIVTKELIAEDGEVIIETTEVLTNNVVTSYKHNISFSNLLFFDGTDRVYFETFTFGSITISL